MTGAKSANHFLESMELAEIPDSAYNLENFDYVTQCNYGLAHQPPVGARSIFVS